MDVVQNIKCIVIGSKLVGKTSLLNSYVASPQSYDGPFDNYNGVKVQIEEQDEIFQLELWDTNCADHHKIIRKIYYENCSVVLICFSVMDHESFRDVRKKVSAGNCPATSNLLRKLSVDSRSPKVLPVGSVHHRGDQRRPPAGQSKLASPRSNTESKADNR